MYILETEALVKRCSVKKVLLEILQNSQENTCARVSFLIKLQASSNFIKKETLENVFSCEFYEISKNTFPYRTPPVAASVEREGQALIFFVTFNIKSRLSWKFHRTSSSCSEDMEIFSFNINTSIFRVFWHFLVKKKLMTSSYNWRCCHFLLSTYFK